MINPIYSETLGASLDTSEEAIQAALEAGKKAGAVIEEARRKLIVDTGKLYHLSYDITDLLDIVESELEKALLEVRRGSAIVGPVNKKRPEPVEL